MRRLGFWRVYLACTSVGRFRCFWRFSRLIESVTYASTTPLLVRSPPPLPISFISLRLFLDLTPIRRLTPIELIHRVQFNPRRTVFNCTALLVANHVPVDSQRDSWVAVPQLLLHHSWGCTVWKQSTCRTVTHGVEPARSCTVFLACCDSSAPTITAPRAVTATVLATSIWG
jgi:hypothetical protein